MVSFTIRLLKPRGKGPRFPLDMRLGGFQSLSRQGDKKNPFIVLVGNTTPVQTVD